MKQYRKVLKEAEPIETVAAGSMVREAREVGMAYDIRNILEEAKNLNKIRKHLLFHTVVLATGLVCGFIFMCSVLLNTLG